MSLHIPGYQGCHQVWSLANMFLPLANVPQGGSSAFSKISIIKICVNCSTWRSSPGISTPSTTHLTVSSYLWFLKQCTRWVKGPWRAPCHLKNPFKGLKQRWGSCWEERKRKVFPSKGSLISPPSKSMIFSYLISLIFDCLRPPDFTKNFSTLIENTSKDMLRRFSRAKEKLIGTVRESLLILFIVDSYGKSSLI